MRLLRGALSASTLWKDAPSSGWPLRIESQIPITGEPLGSAWLRHEAGVGVPWHCTVR